MVILLYIMNYERAFKQEEIEFCDIPQDQTTNGIPINAKDFYDLGRILKLITIKHMLNKNEPQETTLTVTLKSWITN